MGEILVDCPNCGKQNILDCSLDETCLFCNLPLRKKVEKGATEQMFTQEPKVIRVEPRKSKRAHHPPGYLEAHKEEIIADHQSMRLIDFFKKWRLSSNTWTQLKKGWGVIPKFGRSKAGAEPEPKTGKRTYKRGKKFYHRYPHLLKLGARKLDTLPKTPEYWEGYQQAVLDGAPRIIMNEEGNVSKSPQ